MNSFINVAQFIVGILFSLLGAVLFHFLIFAVVGIWEKRSYPRTDIKQRYGVIIPARNEEKVISGLIESVRKNNYPQDKLEIFVVAHNCNDSTAAIARSMGAAVYEYNNPEENTMGYAFKHLFSCIERDYGVLSFDGFLIFNADNILDKNYISYMNDAFVFYEKKCIITSFRNSKNFGKNLISGLYGMYFTVGCRMESRGRTVLGCSTRVQGTGYLINSNVVKNGWNYVTLAEDWEFTADRLLISDNIRYCDDAVFYDEQPTSFKIMWRQRVRWSRGHLIVFYTRIKDLIKGIFSHKAENRFSLYDFTANVLPSTLFFLVLQILQIVLSILNVLFDKSASFKEIFLGNSLNIAYSNGFLFTLLRSWAFSYITVAVSAVIIFIAERKRIKGVRFARKMLIVLLWPFFLAIQFLIDIQAFFSLNLKWRPIPHNDSTTFDRLN